MRQAVYNRYWHTAGGGEKVAGAIAEALVERGEVDLVTHELFDPAWLGERLGLDLSGVKIRVVDGGPSAVTEIGEEYDLFVNASFMSHDPCTARRGLYYVHFPTPVEFQHDVVSRFAVQTVGAMVRDRPAGYRWGVGFHDREPGRRAPIWTSGSAELEIIGDEQRHIPVNVTFGFHRPRAAGDVEVRILADGECVATTVLGAPASRLERVRGRPIRFSLVGRGRDDPIHLSIESDTFVPAEVLGGSDTRVLGVPILSIDFGSGLGNVLGRAFPMLWAPPADKGFLEGYDLVVSNSEFTRRWVRRYWDVETEVLHPPVTVQQRRAKLPLILNVGRFFPAAMGHSKKQLELVEAFRRLCDAGMRGWVLRLVGGCKEGEEDYLRSVQHRAEGYPVEFCINATGAELGASYGQAAIYWHAAGYGENEERHPDRFEHFGITTAEAMSAGAVPIVINRAGQAETVRHGVDGYRFETLDDLAELTAHLLAEPDTMRRFSASAEQRAQRFSVAAFERQLLSRLDALP